MTLRHRRQLESWCWVLLSIAACTIAWLSSVDKDRAFWLGAIYQGCLMMAWRVKIPPK